MIRVTIGISLLILLTSCGATKLTQGGETIRLVETKKNCEAISVVTGSEEFARNSEVGAEGSMNIVRNKAAEAGGNALKILSITPRSGATVVVGEALKCR